MKRRIVVAIIALVLAVVVFIGLPWYREVQRSRELAKQALLTIHQEIEEKEKLMALGNINVDLSGLTLERLNSLLQQQAHRLDSNTSSTRLGWACGGELCAIQAAFPLPAGRDIPLSAAPMLVVVSGVGFGRSFSGSVGGIH
jgi:hypothetical protein